MKIIIEYPYTDYQQFKAILEDVKASLRNKVYSDQIRIYGEGEV